MKLAIALTGIIALVGCLVAWPTLSIITLVVLSIAQRAFHTTDVSIS